MKNPFSLSKTLNLFVKRRRTFTPSQISGLNLWLETDFGLYQERSSHVTVASVATDPVGTWLDQSGNNRHVTAQSDARRPLLQFNGYPVLRFDGSDDSLYRSGYLPLNSAFTVFQVAKANNTNATKTLTSHASSGSATLCHNSVAALSLLQAGTGQQSTGVTYTTAWGLFIWWSAGPSGSNMTIDVKLGASTGTANRNITTGTNGFLVSGSAAISPTTNLWNGDLAALLIYNSVLPETDRDTVAAYLTEKYSL